MAKNPQLILTVVISMYLVGCSSVDYNAPINGMATAASQAQATMKTLSDAGTQNYIKMYVTSPDRYLEPVNCGAVVSPGETCQLKSSKRPNLTDEVTVKSTSEYQNALAITNGIVDYATGLQSIQTADTATEVQNAVTATLGNLERIGSTAIVGRSLSDFTPVTNLLNWFVGQYVNKLKKDGLEKSIKAADPAIQDAVCELNKFAEVSGQSAMVKMANDVRTKQDAYNAEFSAANAQALFDSVNIYNNYIAETTKNPKGNSAKRCSGTHATNTTFTSLGKAHAALLKAVEGGDKSFVEYVNALNGFLIQAKNVQDLAKAIESIEVTKTN